MMTSEQTAPFSYRDLLREVTRRLRPYRGRFLIASMFRAVGDTVFLYPAIAFAQVVDYLTTYTPGASLAPVWWPLGIWAVILCIRHPSMFVGKYIGFQIAERVTLDVEMSALRHLTRLDIAWHERENAGNKLKRIESGGAGLQRVIRLWFATVIESIIRFVGTFLVIAHINRTFGAIFFAFIFVFTALATFFTRRAGQSEEAVNVAAEHANGLAFETISNIRSVKVMGMAEKLLDRFQQAITHLFARIRVRIFRYQLASSVTWAWANFFRVGSFGLIALSIARGELTIGFLIIFNWYLNSIIEAANEVADMSQEIVTAKYGVARLRDILDEPVQIDDDAGKQPMPVQWRAMHVADVSFSYGALPVLQNISFDLRRGEKVGIVGLSGAGKSTLFKLLLNERSEYTGQITIDKMPLADIRRSEYLTQTAVVLQDTEVFNFSLRDNITIANPARADDAELLERALTIAHVHDFIPKLPQGLDTLIGEKGFRLSGGEKQRLGIARAIFKEPQLLLLDEATSHLDLESEEKIQDALHRFFARVTAVVIAHRLTTIREMDRIIVLEDGRILEEGTFDALMKKRGRFCELWEKQRL